MILAVPAATAEIVNVTLDEPSAIVTPVCTVATAGLLLDSEMTMPVDAAIVRLTVPSTLRPTTTFGAVTTAETPGVVGAVVELPHPASRIVATAVAASVVNGVACGLVMLILTITSVTTRRSEAVCR